MSMKPIFDFDTTCFTTYTKATTPIVCAAPMPSCSPKRKYSCDADTSYYGSSAMKRQRLSASYESNLATTPTTPLYRNFGNGLSLCNNTKTNRLSTFDEILQYLTNGDSKNNSVAPSTKSNDLNEQSVSDDIVNELMIELNDKNELPELNVLLDLKDVFHADLDFLL